MDVEKKHSRRFFLRFFSSGFTTSEVLISVVIILILATLAIVGYTQVIDNAYQRVCATNQTIIMRGIERHFLTTGIAPATLGDIKLEYWKDAYAEVMKDRDWQTRLSYFLVKITTAKQAYADIKKLEHLVNSSEMKVYGIVPDVFHCPADKTPENPSYGINGGLKNYIRWKDVPADMTIIGDSDHSTFSSEDELTYRHRRKLAQEQIAQAMTKSMHIVKAKFKKDKDKDEETPKIKYTTEEKENNINRISDRIGERIEDRIAEFKKRIETYQESIKEYEQKIQDQATGMVERHYYENKIVNCNTAISILKLEIKLLEAIAD